MLFTLTKIAAFLLTPYLAVMMVLIAGALLLWFGKRRLPGRILISAGILLLLLFSSPLLTSPLLRNRERSFPAMIGEVPQVKWVVVLGGGVTTDAELPGTSRLSSAAMVRLAEGIRLFRLQKNARLVVSGGPVLNPVPEADEMAALAIELGIAPQSIHRNRVARDTDEEARDLLPVIGREPFILVTSASHLPRAVEFFRKRGMVPIPAPTDHQVRGKANFSAWGLVPRSHAWGTAERLTYEWLGTLWAKVRPEKR